MKTSAKASLRNTRPSPVLVTLVYLILTTGINLVITGSLVLYVGFDRINYLQSQGYFLFEILLASLGSVGRTLYIFINILFRLYSLILAFGYASYTLSVSRNRESGYRMLLDGFGTAGKILLLELIKFIFIFLWSLLFVIPGLVAAYRYRMAYYILLDDPECGAMEAIRRSKAMMADHKMELFIFDLSFINWFLLIIPPILIAYILVYFSGIPEIFETIIVYLSGTLLSLWLFPYIYCTTANFYAAIGGGPRAEEPPVWSGGPDIRF